MQWTLNIVSVKRFSTKELLARCDPGRPEQQKTMKEKLKREIGTTKQWRKQTREMNIISLSFPFQNINVNENQLNQNCKISSKRNRIKKYGKTENYFMATSEYIQQTTENRSVNSVISRHWNIRASILCSNKVIILSVLLFTN